jgi:hypothetical protein
VTVLDGYCRYCGRRLQIKVRNRCQRLALAVQIVLDTAQDEGASQLLLALPELGFREPMSGDDSVVQRLRCLVIVDRTAECESHRGHATLGASPQVHAHERLRLETPGGFLSDLAHDGGQQRFTTLDVSGRLIEDEPLIDPLLHYEETAFALGDRGDSDFRLRVGHTRNYSDPAAHTRRGGQYYPRRATRRPWSAALAFQMESNSCRYSLATGGLLRSAMPSQRSARMRYMIARSSAIR